MSDKVIIGPMEVKTHIGWLERERKKRQAVEVTLVFSLPTDPAAASEDLGKTVDFDIMKEVKEFVERTETKLVETLAERIAEVCLGKPAVENVEITVQKRLPFDRSIPAKVTIYRER